MSTDKSPGTDELTKEFHQLFWHDIKAPFISSFWTAYQTGE